MNPQEINIAIAEYMGWKWYQGGINPNRRFLRAPDYKAFLSCIVPWTGENIPVSESIPLHPNYYNDLNAMHEAESHLKNAEGYQEQLHDVVKRNKHIFTIGDAWWYQIHATAAQRAESFLKAIRKWRDE